MTYSIRSPVGWAMQAGLSIIIADCNKEKVSLYLTPGVDAGGGGGGGGGGEGGVWGLKPPPPSYLGFT